MSRHRLDPPRRVVPRFGRIAAAGFSVLVTLVALLGGLGVIPVPHAASYAGARLTPPPSSSTPTGPRTGTPTGTPTPSTSTVPTPAPSSDSRGAATAPDTRSTTPMAHGGTALPADSGTGRRIVFDMAEQRVWLVGSDGAVLRTYLVSGSLTDNLHAGSYSVFSKSRWAVGIGDSGVMQYFVRFAHGQNAAIGFHSIPTLHGKVLQTRAQLGTPQSHGCIRQWLPDAVVLWNFAPVGTKVVVTA